MITSPEEFRARLAEIQQNNRSAMVRMVNPSNEPRFIIDADTRVITVPTKLKQAAVYRDHNAETLYFEIDRYFDDVDLSDKTAIVQYINANGGEYIFPITDYYFEGDKYIVAWKLSGFVAEAPGRVTFSLRFYEVDVDNNNEFLYSFNTETASFDVAKSLDLVASPGVHPSGSDLEELVQKINEIYGNGELSTVDYNTLVFNKPRIGGKELMGDMSLEDLGIIIPITDIELKAGSSNPIANSAVTAKFDSIDVALDDITLSLEENNGIVTAKFSEIDAAIEELQNKKVDMDSELNEESTNPVENQAIAKAINALKEEIEGLTYIPITISNFEVIPAQAEIGETISTVNFLWSLSKTPLALAIDDNTIEDLAATSYTLSDQSITTDTTYTLKATDRSGEITAESTILFMNGLYYGVAEESEVDSAFVLNLTKQLNKDLSITFTVEAEANQFIYFAAPSAYGEPIFTVGGFDGGFTKLTAIQFSNSFGHEEEYNIYRSDNMNLGNTVVKVS